MSRHAEDLEVQVEERTASLRDTIGELEAFSYSISHDMRAPLRAMQSFGHILAKEYGPQLDAQGKEYIRRITASAERMDRLIQDVLTYSRVTRTDLPLARIDLEKLLRDVLLSYPMFQRPAAEIDLEGEFPPVLGIEAVLTQCLSNLLGNAVKFVAPGVTPRVRVWAETDARTPDGADLLQGQRHRHRAGHAGKDLWNVPALEQEIRRHGHRAGDREERCRNAWAAVWAWNPNWAKAARSGLN